MSTVEATPFEQVMIAGGERLRALMDDVEQLLADITSAYGPELARSAGTTLAAGRTTYYFRTSFSFSGATSNVTLDVRAIVDDGAVFHLNGVEIARQNMPTGAVAYATSASGPVGDAGYANPIVVPA